MCPFVCQSVCSSVTGRHCTKTAKRRITQTLSRDRPRTVVGGRPPIPPEMCGQSDPPTPFRTPQFWPIAAHSSSTVRADEKSSISTNRKSTMRFPTSHRWIVYVTPKSLKGGTNSTLLFLPVKFNFCWKKIWYKVCLCENFQQHRCSYLTFHRRSAGELWLIGSHQCAFHRAIDEPCALPLSPPKSGSKQEFLHIFALLFISLFVGNCRQFKIIWYADWS